jgi:hypothetical protein
VSTALRLSAIYDGPVSERLQLARRLYHLLVDDLLGNGNFVAGMAALNARAAELERHMAGMDLGPLCSRCATVPDGGCCSLYMAGETDAVQMLMNLLTGIAVEQVRDDGRECVFLGVTGCIFRFKPMFCLNYNCSHIQRTATPEAMRELERLAGALLTEQYALEQLLLATLRNQPQS